MTFLKIMFIAAFAAFGAGAPSDYGPEPAQYETALVDYVHSRLADARGARIVVDSEPYRVIADFGADGEFAAWAVDIRVRARLASGGAGGFIGYTVIFVNGEPVAFDDDIAGVKRSYKA